MSGPKHLWSGDWESESRRPAVTRPPDDQPEVAPEHAHRTGFSRSQLLVALGAGVAAAAVTVALALTLGGSHRPTPHGGHSASASTTSPGARSQPGKSGGGGLSTTTPSATCAPTSASCSAGTTTTPPVSGPSADWMGMQIITSPGGVVVNTVRLGSPADLAGFEPGDQIESVDGHLIGSVPELRSDTDAVRIGGPVTIDVMRSSVQLSLASVHMTQRPTIHP